MKTKDSVWQGHFGYWQDLFIHQNILLIGGTAWDGYSTTGRGLVVCTVAEPISSAIDWSLDTVVFDRAFIPQTQVEQYLQKLELEQNAVTALLSAIETYDFTRAIVLLIIGNGAVDIHLLQNLKVSPAHCYAQMQQRWAEFQPAVAMSQTSR